MDRLLELVGGLRPRADGAPHPPWNNRSGIIRRFIYSLVLRYRREGKIRSIRTLARLLERVAHKVPFEINPFYYALALANGHGGIELSEREISEWSHQMRYAAKHMIEPELLIGFLMQQGKYRDLKRKLDAGDFEPWFEWRSQPNDWAREIKRPASEW